MILGVSFPCSMDIVVDAGHNPLLFPIDKDHNIEISSTSILLPLQYEFSLTKSIVSPFNLVFASLFLPMEVLFLQLSDLSLF